MELKNIAKSFIRAKMTFAPAIKSSTNPHFRNKYADLAACIEAVDDAFLQNGIVMYQETSETEHGVTVETVLLHESGEMIRCGKLHMPASKADAQGFMSALTYCRRGSLMAAAGIAPEDDDGQAASRIAPKPVVKPVKAAVEAPALVYDADAMLAEVMSANTIEALNALYSKWAKSVTKGSEQSKYLIQMCKAKKEDLESVVEVAA